METTNTNNTKCPKCKYNWEFKGKLKHRRTCPSCGHSFFIKKREITA
jgi:uncharacterized protein (DUF983 family)